MEAVHQKGTSQAEHKELLLITQIEEVNKMGKSGGCTPPNGPSTTGNPSGGGRGNCPPRR